MNTAILIFVALSTSFAFAAPEDPVCEAKAERSVSKFVEVDYYDKDGFEAYGCIEAQNKKAIICTVSASKGEGAASDTYRVVLNSACTRAFRVELIGEE